ncbi:Sporulation kinase A [Paenibacillus konkukensis]|uniref:histidine kinase n=1 Tax=Paenibacillus konkukensis TaxID=2020716 RepID=A0ABY4RI36_9BACL|nr:HAMP domain-containing sensor histidine kinase [Paenibacillus konkukensis]UQZ81843.1 Sporulation kinase A [Paenibacillus konkukensis]
MLSYFKDYLLNIFFIFSPLVFYPYIYKTSSNPFLYRLLLYVLVSVALVTTMSFPIELNGLKYDFRSIPLTIGSLYGGSHVSALLYLTLVTYRYLTGNPNNWLYAVSLLPSFLIVYLTLRNYSKRKLLHKLLLAVTACTCIKMITFSFYLSALGQMRLLFVDTWTTLETYILQAFIVGVCVYLIECLNRYFRMQEEVIQSEKIKIVSDMAASVAHEIRNPLTTVRGFIQLLGAEHLDQDKKQFYRNLCLEELDRAQLIITDYLTLAKPDPELIENIDIHEEIRYLSNVLMTYANYYNIHINTVIEETSVLRITGDKYKFRQALINIGKNGIEAMAHGGLLEIYATADNDGVAITISDTGTGMTKDQIQRLGNPYYSTKEKGTGLGTMVSFGIIKKMGGKIDIQSVPGEGTLYRLVFPKADMPESAS